MDQLVDPQSIVPEAIMPQYAFLMDKKISADNIADVLATNRLVGVPYTDEMIETAAADFRNQADPDSDYDALLERYPGAVVANFDGQRELTEMDALVAYLQMLGTLVDFSTFIPETNR